MSRIRLELGNKEMPQVKSPVADASTVISTVIESMTMGSSHEAESTDEEPVPSALEAELSHSGILKHVDTGAAIIQRLYDVCVSAPTSILAAVVLQNLEELSDSMNAVRTHCGLDVTPLRVLNVDLLADPESPQMDLPLDEAASVTLRVDPRFFQTPNSAVILHGYAAVFPILISKETAALIVTALLESSTTPDFPEVALFATDFDSEALDYLASLEVATKCRIVPVSVMASSIDAFKEFVAEYLGMEDVLSIVDAQLPPDTDDVHVDVQMYLSPQEYMMFSSESRPEKPSSSDSSTEVILDTVP